MSEDVPQCEMCHNGRQRFREDIDGEEYHLCSTCRDLLATGGRVEGPAMEVA